MKLHASSIWIFAVSLLISPPTASSAQQTPGLGGAGLANPASTNCVDKLGGTLQIVDTAKGQAGYCHLKDGRVCEEWALFRDGACVAPQN
jgi:putative hemolysin